MRASDIRSFDPIRYGAYICLNVPAASEAATAGAEVPALAERLGLCNEYASAGGDPPRSIAYLRRVSAVPGQITDAGLLGAEAIVHVAAPSPEPIAEFRTGLSRLLARPSRLASWPGSCARSATRARRCSTSLMASGSCSSPRR